MITLTQQERDKFAAYLKQEADTNKKLVEQLEKLPGGGCGMEKVIKQDAVVFAFVAGRLQAVEALVISEE